MYIIHYVTFRRIWICHLPHVLIHQVKFRIYQSNGTALATIGGKKNIIILSRGPRIYYLQGEKLYQKSSKTCAIKKIDEEAILSDTNNNCNFCRILLEI